jgi:hypothetical protein
LAYAILARAKREGWSKQIQSAKALAKRDDTSTILSIGGNVNLGTQTPV